GTVKVNGAFAGTLWAPGSTVQVNKASSPLVGAVYAANVTVMNDAQLHFERPAALACLPKQVRIPRAATCSTNSLSVTSHAGVTRAIWEGIESAADGKRVNPHESFTFAFSAPVTLADLAGAVSLVSVDCPAAGPQDCGHEVELT